jgi:hypothetical protein
MPNASTTIGDVLSERHALIALDRKRTAASRPLAAWE